MAIVLQTISVWMETIAHFIEQWKKMMPKNIYFPFYYYCVCPDMTSIERTNEQTNDALKMLLP